MSANIKVREQIMWNRLISVVEEQAATLIRTAFCTSVREAGDLSAGVFDAQGRMIAQAVTGTPGHVNSMAESVGHFVAKFGEQGLSPGDALVTNDPWMGTGHLHDITMVTPVYRKPAPDAAPCLIGFFAAGMVWVQRDRVAVSRRPVGLFEAVQHLDRGFGLESDFYG